LQIPARHNLLGSIVSESLCLLENNTKGRQAAWGNEPEIGRSPLKSAHRGSYPEMTFGRVAACTTIPSKASTHTTTGPEGRSKITEIPRPRA